ncbi:GNAT family N-acetyltransferase [Actinoplanes sp. NPDC049265]|uniref:GNAT family N-acetyltransferase n=1 Tax=Actinoplanes sp. NPDC049265 TaxID=3363902 RepID=UPI003722DD3C
MTTINIEAVEAAFMRAYLTGAPASHGPASTEVDGVVVLALRDDPNRYWNKAVGFTKPVTGALLDEIIGFWQDHGTAWGTLQIPPELTPDDWAELCASRGIEDSGGRVMKLSGPIGETTPAGPAGLDVRPVTEADARAWAEALVDAYEFEREPHVAMFLGMLGDSRCRSFAVWDSGRVVAGANLYLLDGVGGLGGAGTGAGFRRRGAQNALIAARIAAAREAGCHTVVAETGWSDASPRHSSLNNMRRAGLEPNYIRPNWRWTAA